MRPARGRDGWRHGTGRPHRRSVQLRPAPCPSDNAPPRWQGASAARGPAPRSPASPRRARADARHRHSAVAGRRVSPSDMQGIAAIYVPHRPRGAACAPDRCTDAHGRGAPAQHGSAAVRPHRHRRACRSRARAAAALQCHRNQRRPADDRRPPLVRAAHLRAISAQHATLAAVPRQTAPALLANHSGNPAPGRLKVAFTARQRPPRSRP